MANDYAIRPTKLVVATAASITATAVATPTTVGVVPQSARYVFLSSTSNQAVAFTIQYPGESPQDFIEIPLTATSIVMELNLGASGLRVGNPLTIPGQVGSITVGAYNLGTAPTSGRITLSFM